MTRERVADALAFGLAAYALYWVVGVVDPQIYRVSFLLIALLLTFFAYPLRARTEQPAGTAPRQRHGGAAIVDAALVAITLAALLWPIVDFDAFVLRAATPTSLDVALGIVTIAVVLEATRRTTGWILPVTALLFLAYAWFGPVLDRIGLPLIAHRGYAVERVVGTLYMTLEGIFGVPLDVAATYIIL